MLACVSALNTFEHANLLNWEKPRSATKFELELIHTQEYISQVKSICESGGGYLDSDTPVCTESYDVALKSAGAWLDGVDELIKGVSTIVLSRPPGHHAESNKAMGFCLFSNAALSATYAIKQKKCSKVMIFDWDVHHGNGTQNIIQYNPDIYYVSTHQFPFYPGTGSQMETGKYNNILNIPLTAGLGSVEYRDKFDKIVLPFIYKVSPDMLIISAGFDAHRLDHLASINLDADDYAYMTRRLQEIQPNLLLGLEGGYNMEALKECCVAVVNELV